MERLSQEEIESLAVHVEEENCPATALWFQYQIGKLRHDLSECWRMVAKLTSENENALIDPGQFVASRSEELADDGLAVAIGNIRGFLSSRI